MKRKCTSMSAILIALLLILPTSVASAVDSDMIESPISFSEYEAAIVAEYEKFGLEGGVYEPTTEFYCTPSQLEEDLATVREFAKRQSNLNFSAGQEWAKENQKIQPLSMYTDVEKTCYTLVFSPDPLAPAYCEVRTTATFKVDVQNSYIASGSKPALSIRQTSNYDDYCDLLSYRYVFDQVKHTAMAYITCDFKLTYPLSFGTTWSKIEQTFEANFGKITT
ncbi:MAG: hypothetical protein HFF30_07095 [Flavonifractor sp.]|jgi:hypothetical protein|nr:hypothetical protein [Flavonifractor sp.]